MSLESINCKLFLTFVGVIMRKALERKLRLYLAKSRIGLNSAIDHLTDISYHQVGETWIFKKEMTKQQNELVDILQLPVSYLTGSTEVPLA